MKYLIVGVSLRSRGGEAMVLETCRVVKELDSRSQIFLLTNSDYDISVLKKIGNPYGIRVIVRRDAGMIRYLNVVYDFFAIILVKILKRVVRRDVKIPHRTLLLRCLDDNDVVLEIAGISFTDNFGLFNAINSTIRMLSARLLGKKYFCLPQAYGPSDNMLIRLLAKIGLSTVTCIMPRGRFSMKFLRDLSIKSKVIFVPDLAFSFENPSTSYKAEVYQRIDISPSRKYVGVLPNVHLYRWGGMKTVSILATLIDYLAVHLNYFVLLIPHEVHGNVASIDDEFVCNLIYRKVRHKSKVIMVPSNLTANEIKSLIGLCDFTIVSRYHAMISSLKMLVPLIVIGWANKYYETMELFDLTEFVIDYKNLEEKELINKITTLLCKREVIVKRIKEKLSKYERASSMLKGILRNELFCGKR